MWKLQKQDFYAEHRKKVLALLDEFDPVIKAAGIEKELEEAQRLPEADYFRDQHLPPLGTDAYYKELHERDADDEHYRRWKIRDFIFGLKDEDLRRKLIVYIRKSDELWLEELRHELREKERQLRELRQPDFKNMFGAAITCGLMVFAAMSYSLALGLAVLTGVVVAAMYGVKYEEAQRRVAIREAIAEVARSRAEVNQRVALQAFSYSEERGTPDDEDSQGDINSPKRMMIWQLDRWQAGEYDSYCPICRCNTTHVQGVCKSFIHDLLPQESDSAEASR